ncbi:MAG: sugar ABC transporter permease [Dehalococcoidales bacterium]|nr:sugar ABC transporter permease [Dehalococcoidales bacterium]
MAVASRTAAGEQSTGARLRKWLGPDAAGYLLIAPAYFIYIVFILAPVFAVGVISLTSLKLVGDWQWIGLQNFSDLWGDHNFTSALRNTAVYSLFTLVPAISIGLVLAAMLNRKIRGLAFFRQVYYLPNVISTVAAAVTWLWIFDPANGFMNRLLGMVGLPQPDWLYDVNTALPALIMVGVWKSLGFNMVIYLAALQGIPREIYEAARVDGAKETDAFFHITIPLVQPTTFFLLIMGFINGFQVFDQIYIMTQGGPANATTTLVHQIYLNAFFYHRMGYASAISMLLMGVVAAVTLANFRYGQQGKLMEVS